MTLKVYNTLTKRKEKFVPQDPKEVHFFVCGPTVYDYAHIGHARSYVAYDVIVKYLRYKGLKVFYLQNITDIDDKIIKRAHETNKNPKELAKEFEEAYYKDIQQLKVNAVTKYAPATEYIPEIISQVQQLLDKKYAYLLDDGIYYEVQKFKRYGKLSGQPLEDLKAGARMEVREDKKHPADFVLWKLAKPGEPSWQATFTIKKKQISLPGRPGWHIEDTAIAEKHFGQQYDAHGGGLDLIRPHHEAEIAQMEAISKKKPYVRYWLHNGFVNMDEEKMSKSLHNFKTIRDLLKEYHWQTLRFFLLSTHYRSPINFTQEGLENAKKTLARIHEAVRTLKNYKHDSKENEKIKKLLEKTQKALEKSLDNDFETARAIAALFGLIKKINTALAQQTLSQKNKEDILKKIEEWNTLFEVLLPQEEIPQEIYLLAQERQKAREEKNWQKSDEVREEIKKKGFLVQDTKEGFQLEPLER